MKVKVLDAGFPQSRDKCLLYISQRFFGPFVYEDIFTSFCLLPYARNSSLDSSVIGTERLFPDFVRSRWEFMT